MLWNSWVPIDDLDFLFSWLLRPTRRILRLPPLILSRIPSFVVVHFSEIAFLIGSEQIMHLIVHRCPEILGNINFFCIIQWVPIERSQPWNLALAFESLHYPPIIVDGICQEILLQAFFVYLASNPFDVIIPFFPHDEVSLIESEKVFGHQIPMVVNKIVCVVFAASSMWGHELVIAALGSINLPCFLIKVITDKFSICGDFP